jgi:hypothetical protein
MHKILIKVTYRHQGAKRKVLTVHFESLSREQALEFIQFLKGETRDTGALIVMTRAFARGVVERTRAQKRRVQSCN